MGGILDDDASYGLDQSAVADVINNAGVQGALSVSTTAIEVRVGASRLVNRKLVTVFNDGSATVYWGYTNAVTAVNGTPIFKNQIHSWDAGDSISIWLIAASGSHTCRITEAS